MAKSTKTQHSTQRKKAAEQPSAQDLAAHFMSVWQDQWQDFLRDQPTMATDLQKMWMQPPEFIQNGAKGFGFPPDFGQHSNHGPSPNTSNQPDATELAAAALAASRQCLELFEQCRERLDDLAEYIRQLDTGPRKTTRATAKATTAKRPRTR